MDAMLKIGNDEEEYDEPLLAINENNMEHSADMSTEYIESVDAIAADCWDISSWIIFLEEVEHSRGGNGINVAQAYSRILTQFPRSAILWKRMIDRSITDEDWQSVHDAFACCLVQCRSVDLWKLYLGVLSKTATESSADSIEAHKKLEAAYDEALDNVGYCLDAASLWQDCINCVRASSAAESFVEVGKKLAKLRRLYQRAAVVPMDHSDGLWAEYEIFEKVNSAGGNSNIGGESSETVLSDFNKKHLHAKSILRERKRLSAHIQFDRFASPPSHSSAEMQQLEYWNSWTK